MITNAAEQLFLYGPDAKRAPPPELPEMQERMRAKYVELVEPVKDDDKARNIQIEIIAKEEGIKPVAVKSRFNDLRLKGIIK